MDELPRADKFPHQRFAGIQFKLTGGNRERQKIENFSNNFFIDSEWSKVRTVTNKKILSFVIFKSNIFLKYCILYL